MSITCPATVAADVAAADPATYRREQFRVAVATLLAPTSDTSTFTGRLKRAERDPETHPEKVPDPRPPQSEQPLFLRSYGGTIRLERDRVSAFELRMTVDFQTAHEDGLNHFRNDIESMRPGLESAQEGRLPDGPPNPEDERRRPSVHDHPRPGDRRLRAHSRRARRRG